MISNDTVEKGSLPILSEENKINDISMRLYSYLVSISKLDYSNPVSRKAGRRQFQQKDFTVNQIRNFTRLGPNTIEKYWQKLEEEGLIVYEGKDILFDDNNNPLSWSQTFKLRKLNKNTYYSITKPQKFRKVPKETINKILNKLLVSEQELKLYLLLANIQEHCIYEGQTNIYMTYKDLTDLLGIKNQGKNRVAIHRSIAWLSKIGLVKYEIAQVKNNNFNQVINCFKLNQVNFYTDGGELKNEIDSNGNLLTLEMKNSNLDGIEE